MYSWVYNGAPQPGFFTLYGRLHTDDRPDDDHFCFSILYGVMYQEAEFVTNIQQEGPLVISMKINPNIKTGTS